MVFMNRDSAFLYIKRRLSEKGLKILSVTPKNRGRHILIDTNDGSFYCLFKHTFLHSFNYLFPIFIENKPELCGQGETINVECLELVCKLQPDADILYAYESGEVYRCIMTPGSLKKFCNNNSLIREQQKENRIKYCDHEEIFNEKEYCFPIKLLERWY